MASPEGIDDACSFVGMIDKYAGSNEPLVLELGDILSISRLAKQCLMTGSTVRVLVIRSSMDPGNLSLSTWDRASRLPLDSGAPVLL